jgi:hypothetical protein
MRSTIIIPLVLAICTGSWVYWRRQRRAEPFRPLPLTHRPIQYHERTIVYPTHTESVIYWNDHAPQRCIQRRRNVSNRLPIVCTIRLHGFFDATVQHISVRKIRPFLDLIYLHWRVPYDTMFQLEYGNRIWSGQADVSKFRAT